MNTHSTIDELEKLGAISADDARRTMDRLDSIEKSRPTSTQALQYGALGAGAGALTKGISNVVEHGKMPTAKGLIGAAAGGAIGMGALPLVRAAVDRHRERGKLRQFMHESEKIGAEKVGKSAFSASSYSTPIEPAKPNRMVSEGPSRAMPITSAFPKQKIAAKKEQTFTQRLFHVPNREERRGAAEELAGDALVYGSIPVAALGVTSSASIPDALHKIIGGQRFFHGTSTPVAEKIHTEGLNPGMGGNPAGGAAAEEAPQYVADSKGKSFVSTHKTEARTYADLVHRRSAGKPADLLSSSFRGQIPGVREGTVLTGVLPHEDFVKRFSVDTSMPTLGFDPTAFFTKEPVEPSTFKSGLWSIAKARAKDPKSFGRYVTSNPGRLAKGIGTLAAIPLTASVVSKMWGKGRELQERGKDRIKHAGKTAAFAVSQYSGPLSMGPFKMVSGLPPFSAPSLQSTVQRKQDALQMAKSSGAMVQSGLTPKGILASGQGVGKPKISNPSGPSIAELSKPIGFGSKLPGATKGTL